MAPNNICPPNGVSPLTGEEIFGIFDTILGRDPTPTGVKKILDERVSAFIIVERLLESPEFERPKCIRRMERRIIDEDLLRAAYRWILDEDIDGQDLHKTLGLKMHQRELVFRLKESKTFSRRQKKMYDIEGLAKSKAFSERPKTIYLHIPKTAGKAFDSLAYKNYGNASMLSTDGRVTWSAWQAALLVGGHFAYSRYNGMTGQRLFLSVVRDPVERAISRFNFYATRRDDRGIRQREARGFDHDSLRNTLSKSRYRKELINNYQCRYLSGKPRFRAVQKAFARDLFIVGHFDQLDKWLAVVSDRLNWHHDKLPQVNVATNPSYMSKYLEDESLVALLRKKNTQDYELLHFIKDTGVYESADSDFDYAAFKLP